MDRGKPGRDVDELRRERPIFITPGPVVVSKYRDMLEVASLDDVFSVKPYGIAMMRDHGGPNFVLGMDDGPDFEHDLSLLKLAVRRTNLDRIRAIMGKATAGLIDSARNSGTPKYSPTMRVGIRCANPSVMSNVFPVHRRRF